jgi:hypothetical protein
MAVTVAVSSSKSKEHNTKTMNETTMKTVWARLPKPTRVTMIRLFVANHPNMTFQTMASELNVTLDEVLAAYSERNNNES